MLNREAILNVVKLLTEKSEQGQALWKATADTYAIDLEPNVTASVSAAPGAPESYSFRIVLTDVQRPLAELTRSLGEEGYEGLKALYSAAEHAFSESVFRNIVSGLHSQAVIGGQPSSSVFTTTTTTLPPGPTAEQAAQFFRSIAGQWRLEYGGKDELVQIDPSGSYLILLSRVGAVPKAGTRFQLALLACNADLTRVEMAKVHPGGKAFQIETLRVGPNEMVGEAKHDQTSLKYTRQR